MATVTWQGDDLTNPTLWSDADNWDTAAVPTTGDDVVLTGAKNCVIDVATTALASLDASAYTGVLTFGASGSLTVTTTLTLTGISATSRRYITSATLGTPRTITCTGATISVGNCDFRDITFARSDAGALDLTNGGTRLIGDCGGNSKTLGDSSTLTMTTATTTTCTGNSANWSAATWDVRAPLPQDTVVISLTAGQTLTTDMPRLGKNISFGTATHLTLGSTVTSYGSVNLTGMGTFSGVQIWYFESQARSGTLTLTSGGKSYPASVQIQTILTTVQLGDASFIAGVLQLNNGTFIDAGFSVTAATLWSTNGLTRAVTKTGNWTLTQSSAYQVVNLVAAGLTFSDTAGTITISNTGANAKTFAGAGKTFNNVSFPSGTGGVIITGSNTFNDITVVAAGKLVVTAGTTQTVNTFTAVGSLGNAITLASATPGSPFTLTDANGGTNNCDWLNVTDSVGTPAKTWYYGFHGTSDAYSKANGWGNSGISQIISVVQE